MFKAKYLSPMIPSFELNKTADLFTELMGFEYLMNEATYKILHKDNLTIHLLPAGPEIGQMEFYLEVDDIEDVWQRMKDNIEGLKHRAPFNRDYGMRELHIAVPETNTLLIIGQELQ